MSKNPESTRRTRITTLALFALFIVLFLFGDFSKKEKVVEKVETPSEHLFLSHNQHFNKRSVRLPNPLKPDDPSESGATKNTRRYSHFRCSGNDNNFEKFDVRACVFENVCYNLKSKEFSYYIRGDTQQKPVFFDSKRGEIYAFSDANSHGFVALSQIFAGWKITPVTWAPYIRNYMAPAYTKPNSTWVLSGPHALFNHWSLDDSIGHTLWEEIGALYYTMVRLNMISSNLVAMHYTADIPFRPLALKHRYAYFPAVSDSLPVGFYDYMQLIGKRNPSIEDVCFDQLMMGGQMLRFFEKDRWTNEAHEFMYYTLRNRILMYHKLFPTDGRLPTPPKKHRIIITQKTEANYKTSHDIKNKRTIHNWKELSEHLKAKFHASEVSVDVVRWNEYDVREQLRMLQETTILITPAGGVSMIIPFLPEGAHAILVDYLGRHEKYDLFGTRDGESISMDAAFWAHWPHIKKLYYQVWDKSELVSDRPKLPIEAVSWRDEASVIINMERMDLLIEAAMEDMEP